MGEQVNEYGQPIGAAVNHWQSTSPPPRESLTGRLCRIDPLEPAKHVQQLWNEFSSGSPSNWTYLPYGPFLSFEEFNSWILSECTGSDPFFHVVVDPVSGMPLGMASYMRIDTTNGVIEVGHIHFSERLQRTAIATEAMFLMMARVFDELGYRRYEWKCDALNQPSRKAAVRLGFRFEGIFRNNVVYKGRNRDTAWYSITDFEWPHIKKGFTQWLGPGNFDENGKQHHSLSDFLRYDADQSGD